MTSYQDFRKEVTKMSLLLHCVDSFYSEKYGVKGYHGVIPSYCIKKHFGKEWQMNWLTTAPYVLRCVKVMAMLQNERNIVV